MMLGRSRTCGVACAHAWGTHGHVQRLLLAATDDAASTAVIFGGSDERMRARMCATIDLLY